VDVVPKFQAIQAAHEILGDPLQKARYDRERAKLNRLRETESPVFRKPPPTPPRRTDSGYANGAFPPPPPPPPRRDQSTSRYAPPNGTRSRPQSAASASADKFAQFARAAPSWDRARYEEASRAEGLRGLNAMRSGQVPQTPPLRSRHPTAPRSSGADAYSPGAEPSPGFPGLNRTTANPSRGFGTHPGAGDEQQSRSAYAQYNRSARDRPPSAGSFPHLDPQAQQRPRESHSPLRQTRSFHPDEFAQVRPELSRTSSKYATAGGERTQVNTGNIGRSTSVRASPIDRKWDDTGPFGSRSAAEETTARARHSSHSPQGRARSATFSYASETSSEEADTTPPPPAPQDRKKAPLRKPHVHSTSGEAPDLTGYFPNSNYTRVGGENDIYDYPAPETKASPVWNPFANTTSSTDAHEASGKEPQTHTQSGNGVPRNQYATPFTSQHQPLFQRAWPHWAVPSCVCPKTMGNGEKMPASSEHCPHSCFGTTPSRWPLTQYTR